jgi:hypothetical protein
MVYKNYQEQPLRSSFERLFGRKDEDTYEFLDALFKSDLMPKMPSMASPTGMSTEGSTGNENAPENV